MLLGPRRDRPQQEVGVAGDELRQRLDLHVHAVLERAEVERRGPRVVQDHERAAVARRGGDRRDVLDLERLRARRLEVHHPGVRTDQGGDPRADQRVVEGDVHAEAREDQRAELARRAVDRVGHQKVVSLPEERR